MILAGMPCAGECSLASVLSPRCAAVFQKGASVISTATQRRAAIGGFGRFHIEELQVVSPAPNLIKMATKTTMDTKRFRIQGFMRGRWLPCEVVPGGASRRAAAIRLKTESGLQLDSSNADLAGKLAVSL